MKTKNILQITKFLTYLLVLIWSKKTLSFIYNFIKQLITNDISDSKFNNFNNILLHSKSNYIFLCIIYIAFLLFKIVTIILIIKILNKIDLISPFTPKVSKLIYTISYIFFFAGITALIGTYHCSELTKVKIEVTKISNHFSSGGDFVFFSAIVFIIASVFKKGIEIQNENDLTI